jgi:hypothetical protein
MTRICMVLVLWVLLVVEMLRQVLGVDWLPLAGSRRAATHSVRWVLLALCL